MNTTEVIDKVPTKFISYVRNIRDLSDDVNFLVLLIPGNPGIIEFYRDFMHQISEELSLAFPQETIPVWGISHAGHEVEGSESSMPCIKGYPDLYSLEGQISHKNTFIQNYIPEHLKVILIGHSIGCHIIMELLKRNSQFSSQVKKALMLFPTIQRMKDTPNGKIYMSLVARVAWGPPLLLFPFDFLPNWFRDACATAYVFLFRPNAPQCVQKGIATLLQRQVAQKVIAMAQCEMKEVYYLDEDALEKNLLILFFYFGANDWWCPLQYVDSMFERFPSLRYTVCKRRFEHAFVVSNSRPMASILIPEMKRGIEQWQD